MTRIKICGIQRLADAEVAAQAGADYLGLVFVPGRRRCLDTGTAAELTANLRAASAHCPRMVGLFADQPPAEVNQISQAVQLDVAQLCGRETPDYCRQIQAQSQVEIIKVLHIPDTAAATDAAELAALETRLLAYQKAGCRITLDRLVTGLQGGTGQSFDWSVAAALAQKGHQFFLAGGLTPDNVAAAIDQARPWGVDVSSGVETDGVKDPVKIRAFIRQSRVNTSS